MRIRTIIALGAMVLGLSACWKSDAPLISPAPEQLDMSGLWVRDGEYNSGIRYDVTLNEDGYFFADYLADVYKPEADDRLLAFAPLDNHWYLAQIQRTDGSVEAYAVAKASASEAPQIDHIDLYESYCSDETGAIEGVVEDAREDCVFSDLETLTAVAEAQIERIEAGDGDVAIYASYSRAAGE